MDYQGNIIRPPSEADSIILQVTVGCSHNKCTFCGAYKDVKFSIKDTDIINNDIEFASKHFPYTKRLFLADGDVLILSQKRLRSILLNIKKKLPWVKRVRLYGNCKSILSKSLNDLEELKALGLDRIYMGLESGSETVLENIHKGATPQKMIKAALRVKDAGIFLSITVLLGIAGKELSLVHAQETAQTLNQMYPKQIAALTYMPLPNTALYKDVSNNKFKTSNQFELLLELKELIRHLNLDKTQFQANHASNYLPINCRLQRDKQKILTQIDQALSGKLPLMPEYMRAL